MGKSLKTLMSWAGASALLLMMAGTTPSFAASTCSANDQTYPINSTICMRGYIHICTKDGWIVMGLGTRC